MTNSLVLCCLINRQLVDKLEFIFEIDNEKRKRQFGNEITELSILFIKLCL